MPEIRAPEDQVFAVLQGDWYETEKPVFNEFLD